MVVHNGIIENYIKLKKKLQSKGYEFISDTDTEVVAHLLDYYYKGDPLETVTKIMNRVEGSYALGIMFLDHPDELYAVRKDSPLIVGHAEGGNLIASDVPAVLKYTRRVDVYKRQPLCAAAHCTCRDEIRPLLRRGPLYNKGERTSAQASPLL